MRSSTNIFVRRLAAARGPWRAALRRHLLLLLLVKFAALALLWILFFSPPHRVSVDAAAVGSRLMPAVKEASHD